MIEPLRSQYLAALGIDNYAPRFILPGAKLSEPCAWLETLDENVIAEQAPGLQNIADKTATEKTIAEKAVVESAVAEQSTEKSISEIIQRTPIVDAAAKRPLRATETTAVKTASSPVVEGPQFALSMVLAAGGILLIDAAPQTNAQRTAFQQLLNNMLPALRPAAAQYVLDVFIWPLTRQPKIPRDAEAAKEALTAYLQKQIKQRAIDTVLLLGDAAQQWCMFAEGEVRVVKSSSLLACVNEPALKRPLWNDIRHLAEH